MNKAITIKNSSLKIPINKIICVGRNYLEHINELGNDIPEKPVVFLKPNSAVIFSGDEIVHPDYSTELHHEIELLLLIGKTIKNATIDQAEDAIIGYGIGLDMTLRDVQDELKKKGHPWTKAKCFDTSAVLSDFILKKDYHISLNEELILKVNGQVRQKDSLSKMIFKPNQLVEYLSSILTLEYGDIIFTGTPQGVSKVNKGDVLFGSLNNLIEINCSVRK